MTRSQQSEDSAAPEFSRIVNCAELGAHPHRAKLVASAAECAALAQRFDLEALDRLDADVTVSRQAGALFRVDGRFNAVYRQICVITLEPLESVVAQDFTLQYAPRPNVAGEILLDAEAEDWPEPVFADRIDLGEAVAQQLALTVDPYPRKPGATLPQVTDIAPVVPLKSARASIKSLMDKAFQAAAKPPAKKR